MIIPDKVSAVLDIIVLPPTDAKICLFASSQIMAMKVTF